MRVQQRVMKRAAVVVMLGVLGVGLTACGFANVSSSGPSDSYVASLFNALNYDRVMNGLPQLSWSPKLSNQAGTWANHMSDTGSLAHQDLGALIGSPDYIGFRTLGENVFVGSGGLSATQVQGTWMGSGGHRAHILSGSYNVVGIGYYRGPDGRLWVVQDFGGI
jgi:uncharacterized protein YkwD